MACTHKSVSLFHAFRCWGASFKIVPGENERKKVSPRFFPRQFFTHALLSERLEQATSPLTNPFKGYFVVQCYFLFRDMVLCDYEIRGSALLSRSRSSAY